MKAKSMISKTEGRTRRRQSSLSTWSRTKRAIGDMKRKCSVTQDQLYDTAYLKQAVQ